jgi:hypothetical protein
MGSDSDSGGLTPPTPYQWQDLLNQDPLPTHFDAALKSILWSQTEMEKILGLDEQNFRSVIDVLSQVKSLVRFSVDGSVFTDALPSSTWELGM